MNHIEDTPKRALPQLLQQYLQQYLSSELGVNLHDNTLTEGALAAIPDAHRPFFTRKATSISIERLMCYMTAVPRCSLS